MKLVRNRKARNAKFRLDEIRLDPAMRTRAHIDDCTVAEYAEAMLRGDRFPPVVVFQQGGNMILADGWHRVTAARRARLTHIWAEVRTGGRKEALRFALGCNQAHGLRRSNADKRHCVELALAEFGSWSDHLLSDMCGVSVQTVGNVRQQLSNLDSSPRVGKDGKVRALPKSCANGSTGFNNGKANGSLSRQELGGVNGGSTEDQDHETFQQVAEALVDLERMIQAAVNDHPLKTAAMIALVAKARSDLLQLEKRLRNEAIR